MATASRLVAELVSHGLLARDPDRRVRIGMRLWELVTRASPALSLRDAAMPFMEGVHEVVGHHVQLGVLDGDEVLFLERLSAPGAVINYTRIAGRLPLHAPRPGWCCSLTPPRPAGTDDPRAAAPLSPTGRQRPEQLRRALAGVRRQGYAYCPGYVHPEALGIAAPVRDARRRVVAALAVIVPNDGAGRAVVPVLTAAARGGGRNLSSPELSHSLRGPSRPGVGPHPAPTDEVSGRAQHRCRHAGGDRQAGPADGVVALTLAHPTGRGCRTGPPGLTST